MKLLTLDEKLDILDMFKEAKSSLRNPKTKADKLLKAIYLANIAKMEYKIFDSNDYDNLINMIDDCINLKLHSPQGCGSPELKWFLDICNIKQEIEKQKKILEEDPLYDNNFLKNVTAPIINEIDREYDKGKISFFFYILSNHKPNGLNDKYKFQNCSELENVYNNNKKQFIDYLKKRYHPSRYTGNKKDDRKKKYIMRQIFLKLESFYDE